MIEVILNMETDVSVVVAIYNVKNYLEKAVQSCVNQNLKSLEIILVDDGSTDGSGEICDHYANKYQNVKVIHQKNQGLSAARNAGLKIARGKYVAFLDADDYIEYNMYGEMLKKIKNTDADLVLCNFDYVTEDGNILNIESPLSSDFCGSNWDMLNKIGTNNDQFYIVAWNKLYKKELFDDINFPVGKYNEDLFVMPYIYSLCSKVVIMKDIFYHYLQRDNSIMNSEVSIRHLDHIEAAYEFYKFCIDNSYDYLGPNVVKKMDKCYDIISNYKPKNRTEKNRLNEVNEMYKKVMRKYKSKWGWKDLLKFYFPTIYFFLAHIKGIIYEKR